MLVLSRKAGEGVAIGDDVIVTVLNSNGGVVRIGITAPREIKVHRQEVYLRIRDEALASVEPTYVQNTGIADRVSV